MIKEVLCRAADRTQITILFVANRSIALPPSRFTQSLVVSEGFDQADQYIVKHVLEGELVITSDIPLAYDILQKYAQVLNHRGESYTLNEIKQRLCLREIHQQMRNMGQSPNSTAPMEAKQKTAFANALDRWLARAV